VQLGDDDMLEDVNPPTGHLNLGGKKGGLTNDLGRFLYFFAASVSGVELILKVGVAFSRLALIDCLVFQSRKARQNVHGRRYGLLLVVCQICFIASKGGSLKRSALLSEVEWVGDGFSCIYHPQSLRI